MSRKLTTEEIKERIYSLEGDNYKLLSEYVNARTKIRVKHSLCGCEYMVYWSNFKSGCRCPKCNGNYQYTDTEISKLVSEMTDGEYTKLSEYKNNYTTLSIRHNKCNFEYEVRWKDFQKGHRCPKCARDARKYTDTEISNFIYEMTNGEYTKLSEYKDSQTKFKIRHEKCNFEYEIAWNTFQGGVRCPKCAGLMKLTNEDIVKRMHKLVGDEYTKVDDTYINANTKFSIRHNKCNFEYMVRWNDFQQGKRCPKCNQSKGEKFIADYLTNHNISFATQVRFDNCRHKRHLPFDFGILDDNKRVICLVEYNGIQHYESVSFFGGQEALKEVQLRDSIKDNFCKEQNIPLLRIRFDEDIEERLNLFLYKLKAPKSKREMEEALSTN